MSSSLRSILVLLAALAAAANVQAAGKGRRPAAHHARKAPTRVARAKPVAKGRRPAAHHARTAPRHISHTKVNRHRRPAVRRRPVQRVRRAATRNVRQPVRRTTVRTVHRYPVHRVQRRFVRRPYYVGRRAHHRRYTYLYAPGRYAWRTSHYNRGYGVSRRRGSRSVSGIVEVVQGNANNGTLLVKMLRPRSSRFHYARARGAAGWGATTQHRFHLNNGTRYEIMTAPRRGGTIADLHKGERVLVLKHPTQANTAQKVEVFAHRRR